jgi:hypothetical protein
MGKLFALGRVWVMPETTDALLRAGQTSGVFLDKHASEDWGDT